MPLSLKDSQQNKCVTPNYVPCHESKGIWKYTLRPWKELSLTGCCIHPHDTFWCRWSISLLGHQAHLTFSSDVIRWVSLLVPQYHSLVKVISINLTHPRLPDLLRVDSILPVIWAMNLHPLILLSFPYVHGCNSEYLSSSCSIWPSCLSHVWIYLLFSAELL